MINLTWKGESMKRRKFSAGFKSKVALEAIKGLRTVNEIAAAYQVHPNQVSKWKKQLLERSAQVFDNGKQMSVNEKNKKIQQLYQDLGELQYEFNWLKKKDWI